MASARSTGSSPAPSHQHIRTHALASVQRSADGSRAYVEGIAYLSLDPVDGVPVARAEAELRIDSYVTWMRRATLERFAHQFLRHARAIDSQHDHREVGTLVESYITSDGHPTYPPGVWVTRIATSDPATLEALDKGELTGFSIEFVSPITIRVLDIEGHGKVRTGEITDPLPLYLSLVERPSIGIAFESVEVRGEQTAARAHTLPSIREFSQTRAQQPEALGRVTRVLSVNMDADTKSTEGQSTTDATASGEAQTRTDAGVGATKEPAGTVNTDASAPTPEATKPPTSTLDAIPADRRASIRAAIDGAVKHVRAASLAPVTPGVHTRSAGLFASAWADLKDTRAMWDAHEFAFCLYDWITCDIRWSGDSDGEKAGDLETAAREFAAVVSTIAQSLPGYVADTDMAAEGTEVTDVMQMSARAGKAISAANMAHVEVARAACATSMEHLDMLIAVGTVAEPEAEVVQMSEARTEAEKPVPTGPTAIRAMVDAIVSERLAPLVAEKAASEQAAQTAATELTAARSALALAETQRTEAEAARTTAQQRVAELEAMPMLPRSGTDETTAHDAGKTPTKRSIWAGTFLPVDND